MAIWAIWHNSPVSKLVRLCQGLNRVSLRGDGGGGEGKGGGGLQRRRSIAA